jgi:hypothetical protein
VNTQFSAQIAILVIVVKSCETIARDLHAQSRVCYCGGDRIHETGLSDHDLRYLVPRVSVAQNKNTMRALVLIGDAVAVRHRLRGNNGTGLMESVTLRLCR